MATEKRLIDANALMEHLENCIRTTNGLFRSVCVAIKCYVEQMPTVNAGEVEKYKELVERYHDLRENFIDYVCGGNVNLAPYCLNKCEECVSKRGWCKDWHESCKGFNPAEIILMDGDGNG